MRADGKRVKNADLLYTVVPYIMTERSDSMNMITLDIPVEPMHNYINEKRKEGVSISHIALFLAAYVRTMAEFPKLNRFVVARKIYDRNEICVGMVVMKPGEDGNTMSKLYFEPTDTVFDIQNKIDAYYDKNIREGHTNSTDKLADTLGKIPGLLSIGVPILKQLDRWGLLPKAIIDASPFHASMSITNLASIRTNHIFHHCYNFGTTSVFISMGNMRQVAFEEKGETVFKRCLPFGVVMDERIAPGSYFAKAFTRIRRALADPKSMEVPFIPEEK